MMREIAAFAASLVMGMAYPDGNHWVVEPGDTLSIIGQETNHSWQDLCAWNRDLISDCDRIDVGWRLRLFAPDGADPAPTTTSEGTYTGATPVSTWERLAECESGGDWYINTGNGYYGGLQFADTTWDGYGGEQYAPYAHQTGKYNQMNIAQVVLDNQGWGAWPHCSREIGVR